MTVVAPKRKGKSFDFAAWGAFGGAVEKERAEDAATLRATPKSRLKVLAAMAG